MQLTIIADPVTGLLYESPRAYRDGATAYRLHPGDFKPLTESTRAVPTPDGCTVGENAAWLQAGEYIDWNGVLTTIG